MPHPALLCDARRPYDRRTVEHARSALMHPDDEPPFRVLPSLVAATASVLGLRLLEECRRVYDPAHLLRDLTRTRCAGRLSLARGTIFHAKSHGQRTTRLFFARFHYGTRFTYLDRWCDKQCHA